MQFLQRWNFIARARLERELWDAFERGEPIEELVEACRRQAEEKPADGEAALRLSVWETTLQRIRKIEALMEKQKPGGPSPGA